MQTANSFDSVTLHKIALGAGIAMLGAGLTYVAQLGIDFGKYTPIATAVLAILVNAFREYQKGVSK